MCLKKQTKNLHLLKHLFVPKPNFVDRQENGVSFFTLIFNFSVADLLKKTFGG